MQSTGSFEYTRKVLAELKQEILSELQKLGGNRLIEAIIEKLESNLI